MRPIRFNPWLIDLVDANLPEGVKRIDWAETGVQNDAGMGKGTWGLVLESPAGGLLYLQAVHSGGEYDKPEVIVEKDAPDPVATVDLVPVDGRLNLVNVEQWLAALIVNAGNRELASVETYSTREKPGFHRVGMNLRWHAEDTAVHIHPMYTLPAGRGRNTTERFQGILEAV